MLKILTEKKISKPKAIIFDTDNTLYRYDVAHSAAINEVETKAVNMLGINKKEFENKKSFMKKLFFTSRILENGDENKKELKGKRVW